MQAIRMSMHRPALTARARKAGCSDRTNNAVFWMIDGCLLAVAGPGWLRPGNHAVKRAIDPAAAIRCKCGVYISGIFF